MNTSVIILLTATALLVGAGVGYLLRRLVLLSRKSSLEIEVKERQLAAKEKAREIIEKAEKQAEEIKKETKEEVTETKQTLKNKSNELNEKADELKEKQQALAETESQLENKKSQLKNREENLEEQLSAITNMSQTEARDALFELTEKKHAEKLRKRKRKLELNGQKQLEARAKEILVSSLERLSRSVTPDLLSTKIELEEDDLKGKIIGKDGRNIRAFQKATGVELIIDQTPKTITISSFDPVRRAVAKRALDSLLADGRVQPARIERFVEEAESDVKKIIKEQGVQAVNELSLLSLDDRIVAILGRLHFRTSYGQNVLQHSIETAHIAEMLAEEIGIDAEVAKTGALVHDIGKAVDHEFSGSHVEIGMHILEKFGADQAVIDAMKSHHDDFTHASLEAVIVQVADGLSGARPGARKQSLESYISRLEALENIAKNISGVVNSYALEAGREVRVFVDSKKVTDERAKKIAKQIASQIEERVDYPGKVKVHVIREKRLVNFAK